MGKRMSRIRCLLSFRYSLRYWKLEKQPKQVPWNQKISMDQPNTNNPPLKLLNVWFILILAVFSLTMTTFACGVWPDYILAPMFKAHLIKRASAGRNQTKEYFKFFPVNYASEIHTVPSFTVTDERGFCFGESFHLF
jgi:hypothetical protein